MSNVKWCDIGGHAFPEGQDGSTMIYVEQQVTNQWGGTQPERRGQDVCAACASDTGMGSLAAKASQTAEERLTTAREARDKPGSGVRRTLRAIAAATAPAMTPVPGHPDKVLVDKDAMQGYTDYLEGKLLDTPADTR